MRYDTDSLRFLADDWSGPYCRPQFAARWLERGPMRNDMFLNAIDGQAHFFYTFRGHGAFELDGERHALIPGRALAFHSPNRGTLLTTDRGSPWDYLWLCFTGEMALGLAAGLTRRWGWMHELGPTSPAIAAALRLLRDVRQRPLRPAAYWSVRSFEFFTAWWDTLKETAPRLTRVPPADAPPSRLVALTPHSIKDFARQMGYSRQHVHRRLKAQWRRPPGVVLREARLLEAARLLRVTNLSIAEVARQVGYTAPTAFARAFLAAHGQSPRQYRQASR